MKKLALLIIAFASLFFALTDLFIWFSDKGHYPDDFEYFEQLYLAHYPFLIRDYKTLQIITIILLCISVFIFLLYRNKKTGTFYVVISSISIVWIIFKTVSLFF